MKKHFMWAALVVLFVLLIGNMPGGLKPLAAQNKSDSVQTLAEASSADTGSKAESSLSADTGSKAEGSSSADTNSKAEASDAADDRSVAANTDAADEETKDLALSIKEVLVAASTLYDSDAKDIDKLQSDIEKIKDAYEELPADKQADLAGSFESLENAEVSVDRMDDALSGDYSSSKLEDKPNSFRYVNGQPIDEALTTVNAEAQESTGDKLESIDGEDAITLAASGQNTTSLQSSQENSSSDMSFSKASSNSLRLAAASDSSSSGSSTSDSSSSDSSGSVVTYNGIDVSVWQDDIDWTKVKNAGVQFAIIRCGYGSDNTAYDDKKWERNVQACEKLGIPYGVYLYSYAYTTAQVDSEISHVLRLVEGRSLSLPIFYDMEDNTQLALGAKTVCSFAERFCSKIKAAGYETGLYASRSYYQNYFSEFAAIDGYYHWIAEYSTKRDLKKPNYDGRYECFQYSDQGSVNGMPNSGEVDLDYWFGTITLNTEPIVQKVDISQVTFENKIVNYDGTEQAYPQVSNLPNGVNVSYSVSGTQTEVGSYYITATFTAKNSNYELVNNTPKKAKLFIRIKNGKTYTIGKLKYKVTSKTSAKRDYTGTVLVTGPGVTTLTSVKIPAVVKISGITFKVTAIGKNAFRNNLKLKKVTIGSNVSTISAGSFRGCTALKSLIIGEGVKKINGAAFYGDYRLVSITIKSVVLKSITANAFKNISPSAVFKATYGYLRKYRTLLINSKSWVKTMKIVKIQ